jgi:signal transduction histidine kinase
MLDDFGLQAALEWHVRDFARRYGVAVDLAMDGDVDRIPDSHRTCVYRAVQEALTNCVRHATATRATVRVTGRPDRLSVSITDDGVGFDPARRPSGLGLRGIDERVKELHGTMTIESARGKGTTLVISLPLAETPREVPLARAAG